MSSVIIEQRQDKSSELPTLKCCAENNLYIIPNKPLKLRIGDDFITNLQHYDVNCYDDPKLLKVQIN